MIYCSQLETALEKIFPKTIIENIIFGYLYKIKIAKIFKNLELGFVTFRTIICDDDQIFAVTDKQTKKQMTFAINIKKSVTQRKKDGKWNYHIFVRQQNDIYVICEKKESIEQEKCLFIKKYNESEEYSSLYSNYLDIVRSATMCDGVVFTKHSNNHYDNNVYAKEQKGKNRSIPFSNSIFVKEVITINNDLIIVSKKKILCYDPKTLKQKKSWWYPKKIFTTCVNANFLFVLCDNDKHKCSCLVVDIYNLEDFKKELPLVDILLTSTIIETDDEKNYKDTKHLMAASEKYLVVSIYCQHLYVYKLLE